MSDFVKHEPLRWGMQQARYVGPDPRGGHVILSENGVLVGLVDGNDLYRRPRSIEEIAADYAEASTSLDYCQEGPCPDHGDCDFCHGNVRAAIITAALTEYAEAHR